MKKLLIAVTLTLFGLSSLVVSAPSALAEEFSCRTTYGARTFDNVRVPQDRSCTLNGSYVKGNIVVERGAQLKANGVRVIGSIQAEGARSVYIGSSSRVNGSVQIDAGGKFVVSSTTIGGSLQVVSNTGYSRLSSNRVTGDIQVFSHRDGISITYNRVNGNLQCKGNSPAPTGTGNVVQGNKQDQCRRL